MPQVSLVSRMKAVQKASVRMMECCKTCTLKNSTYVPGQLNADAKILFIGEAPGREEAKEGIPFIGQSGKLLRSVLEKLGIGGYSISNVVKCRPITLQNENRVPTSAEIRHCAPMIEQEADLHDFIVLVGGTALGRFFADRTISESVGTALVVGGKCHYVIYHPAYILRNRDVEASWQEDIERILAYQDGSAGVPLTVVSTWEQAESTILKLSQSKRLYLDIETSSLDRFNFQLYCIGIADEEHQYVFEVVEPEKLCKMFNEVLFTKDREVVIQNVLFELSMLRKLGISLDRCTLTDTKVLAYLLDEARSESGGYGQKEMARRLLGYKYWYQVVEFTHIDKEYLYRYNAEDTYVLRLLYRKLWGELTQELRELSRWCISDALKAVAEIEENGVQVDLDRFRELKETVQKKKSVFLEELEDTYGKINWNSTVQVAKLLSDKGISGGQKTATGRVSVSEESLESMLEAARDPELSMLVGTLKKYRELEKLDGTFLNGVFSKVGVGGRVRSQYNFTRTVTGRLSSSRPNFQNIPRDGGIRELFVAAPGYSLLEGDLSQVELRIGAVLSNDNVMLAAFRAGKDLHRLTASHVLGIPEGTVTKEQRYNAKAVNFGFLFGAQWQTFQRYAKLEYGVTFSDEEAQRFRREFFNLYSGLEEYHAKVEAEVSRKGYVESPFGRRRRLRKELASTDMKVRSHAVRQAINSPIQGAASDFELLVIGRTYMLKQESFDPSVLRGVGTVHDQVMLEVKDGYMDQVIDWWRKVVFTEVAACAPWFTVPLVVDLKVGHRWGELKEIPF